MKYKHSINIYRKHILVNNLPKVRGMYMFFVFNKRKIGSYLISIGTVAILFSIALFGEHFGDGEKNVIATSASM